MDSYPLEALVTIKELSEIMDTTTKSSLTLYLNSIKRSGSDLDDVVFLNEEYIGLWDRKNKKPVLSHKAFIQKNCSNCNKGFKSPYYQWIKKNEVEKLLCQSCSRSNNLSRLNKTIIKEKLVEFWSSSRSDNFRQFLSERQAEKFHDKRTRNGKGIV